MLNNNNKLEIDYEEIGKRLRKARGTLSQTAFGEPIGYRYGYVKDCEHGKKPSLEYLFKISNYYNISLDWLIKGVDSITAKINESNETVVNYDLKYMTKILDTLLNHCSPEIHNWTSVQFELTFGHCYEYFVQQSQKKQAR